jgi:D-arabinose 5-phosphate isomerase GutQ
MAQLVSDCAPLVASGQARRAAAQAGTAATSVVRDGTNDAALSAFASSLRADSTSLASLSSSALSASSAAAVSELVAACRRSRSPATSPLGRCVIVSGLGKSAAPAQRFAASLRSIGVSASFIHGSEWVHGDLGCVKSGDAVVFFSHSGRTESLIDAAARLRLVRLLPFSLITKI